MKTPTRDPLWAMFTLLTGLLWFTARTSPGLFLITVGSFLGWLGHPWWGLTLIAVGALIYAQQCSRTPYAACVRCHGIGYRPRRRGIRPCRPCRGKGVRMRWGRTVMNTYRRATHTASTAPAADLARPLAPGTYAQLVNTTGEHHTGPYRAGER